MPQARNVPSSQTGRAIPAKSNAPVCPICRREMAVQMVTQSVSMIGIDETTYACDVCEVEARRAARRN